MSTPKKERGSLPKNLLKNSNEQYYERIAYVFQGGGALGAYQVGVFKALQEHGYEANFLSGISIGSINAAIVAGNPPKQQLPRLLEFWETITRTMPTDYLRNFSFIEGFRHLQNQFGAINAVMLGQPGFYVPRIINPWYNLETTPDKLSFYDTSPLRQTLEKLIDFDRINSKKLTLVLGAVNVKSGELVHFCNQDMEITVDHVMASGALPPAFPAIKIDGEYYWDGGVYANTPLTTVLDALPNEDTLCFMIDCFNLKGKLPTTLDQIEERQKNIRYGSHSRRNTSLYSTKQNFQKAIAYLGTKLTPEAKKDPEVQKVLKLGNERLFSIVHIIYRDSKFTHSFKDYNFSVPTIKFRMNKGYNDAVRVLSNPHWKEKSNHTLADSIYGMPEDNLSYET